MSWIKQKPENETSQPNRTPVEAARPVAPPSPSPVQRESRTSDRPANIGKSVQINGDLTGNEDLVIEGKLEGKVLLKAHQLTIGANGRIRGEIRAKAVTVVGQLVGNIKADDKVEISASGSMEGDIHAPRIVIVDGANFRGSVDMSSRQAPSNVTATQPIPTPVVKSSQRDQRAPEPIVAGK